MTNLDTNPSPYKVARVSLDHVPRVSLNLVPQVTQEEEDHDESSVYEDSKNNESCVFEDKENILPTNRNTRSKRHLISAALSTKHQSRGQSVNPHVVASKKPRLTAEKYLYAKAKATVNMEKNSNTLDNIYVFMSGNQSGNVTVW